MTIYFFRANDRVKIGYTRRASHERKSEWQTGCPYPLTLLGEISGASQAEERRLHFCFKKYRAKNAGREWFLLSEEIEEFIDKFATLREDESPDGDEDDAYETDEDEPSLDYRPPEISSFKVREEETRWVGIKIRDEAPSGYPFVENVLAKIRMRRLGYYEDDN